MCNHFPWNCHRHPVTHLTSSRSSLQKSLNHSQQQAAAPLAHLPTTDMSGFNIEMKLSESGTSSSSEQDSTAELIEIPADTFSVIQPLEPISPVPFHVSSPTLNILPREIRDMIYTNLIAAGSLTILRTSKAVFQEASHFLHKHGICRLVLPIKSINSSPDFLLNKSHTDTIQNLDIRLAMRAVWAWDLETARLISGPSVWRRKCHVSIENNADLPYAPETYLTVPEGVLDVFRSFTSFEILTIRLRFVGREQTLKLLQDLKSQLEGSLGEGFWNGRTQNDWEEQYLEFHPRDHGKESAGEGVEGEAIANRPAISL